MSFIKTALKERYGNVNLLSLLPELEINDDWSFSLPDEFVKQNKKVWEDLGMLEGLKEPERSVTSYNYGMMVVYLLHNDEVIDVRYAGIHLCISVSIEVFADEEDALTRSFSNPRFEFFEEVNILC